MSKLYPKAWEKVILHFDGDSFFASVEQVMNYRLKGKPLVTGGERGAITSASVEAKRLGINRGISLQGAKKICPELVIVSGDYLSYSMFAERMYTIVREWTPLVEEYSIDECFADITGLDKVFHLSYEELAQVIKLKLETSLGITFGVGLGPSKVLAKVASKHHKPAGFTPITQANLPTILQNLPVGKVWGIGPSASILLSGLKVFTAFDFATKPLSWIEAHKLSKPFRETWLELQGYSVKELTLVSDSPQSIIRSRTFRPASSDRNIVFSELSKNIEAACVRARQHRLQSGEIRFYLKTEAFTYHGLDIPMPLPTSSPIDMLRLVKQYFDKVYKPGVIYRTTGIALKMLIHERDVMRDLFGGSADREKHAAISSSIDSIAKRFGEHTVYLGTSAAARKASHEKPFKILSIPYLGKVR